MRKIDKKKKIKKEIKQVNKLEKEEKPTRSEEDDGLQVSELRRVDRQVPESPRHFRELSDVVGGLGCFVGVGKGVSVGGGREKGARGQRQRPLDCVQDKEL